MSKKEKLIGSFLKMPSDFHYDDMVKLLGYFDFQEVKKGKTSGSRVKFENSKGVPIMLHKPTSQWIDEALPDETNTRIITIMKNLEYKGYAGSIEYSPEDSLLYGKVLGVKGLISYEGETGKTLEDGFREAVDVYLLDCKDMGIEPEKPFKGSFNVRIPANLHQKAALLAMDAKVSLNNFVADAILLKVQKIR